MTTEDILDEEPVGLPESATELSDLCATLWVNYFSEKNKAAKKEFKEKYNEAAAAYNKQVGREDMALITANTKQAPEPPAEEEEPKPKAKAASAKAPAVAVTTGGNKIAQIIAHHKAGKSNKEIIALGFNKSTVNRQVGEYKKANK